MNVTEWRLNEETGLKEREILLELFQDFVITKAVINTTIKQSLASWSRAGEVYGVDLRVTNKGPPLADSFVLTEHHRSITSQLSNINCQWDNLLHCVVFRLISSGANSCHFLKVAKVEFLKYSLLKGRIESETWAGISKAEEILEERFHDIDRDTNSRGGQPDKERSKTKKEKNTNIKQIAAR